MKQRIFCLLALAACVANCCAGAQQPDEVERICDSVALQGDWLVSRLQMYWQTQAPDVYVRGELFDHVGGQPAGVPTVKLNGSRSSAATHSRPTRIDDIVPYDDDAEGCVHFLSKETGRMERVHPAKTGCNIASVNRQIVQLARDAARRFVATGEARYLAMALPVLDVYLRGIAARNVPIDLNHGHQQTLMGMATFEVIHEDVVQDVAELYTLLRPQCTTEAQAVYDEALRQWAECIVRGGVPHNNWNLYQADFILHIALALRSDSCYADGHGREHYIDTVINQSSLRQWSLRDMAAFCLSDDGIWYESPGYSVGSIGLFCQLADRMDELAGIDLFAQLPVLLRAVRQLPQYLFPNRMICGFGDTHPSPLSTTAFDAVIRYATRHGNQPLLLEMQQLRALTREDASATEAMQLVTPTFHAPKVSWLMLRTGMDACHDLALSLNGSLGNHQHANGISLELYGKGFVLAPDAGIGTNLYSGLDYAEYYSQFPAHNTVCVDGVSSYPVMMSQHGFTLQALGCNADTTALFAQVGFLEPETQADQLRTCGIVRTSDLGGYYVDVFRSRKQAGGDKMHDYFHHALGQRMELTMADDTPLTLVATDELAFAGGHLYAYSYLYDKRCAPATADLRATFFVDIDAQHRNASPDTLLGTTLWMRGDGDRTVFQALAPPNMEYERLSRPPYDIANQPTLTLVLRQEGEAWEHPFAAVCEPWSGSEPAQIDNVRFFTPETDTPGCVGMEVALRDGRTDLIFSAPTPSLMRYADIVVQGTYAVVRDGRVLFQQ